MSQLAIVQVPAKRGRRRRRRARGNRSQQIVVRTSVAGKKKRSRRGRRSRRAGKSARRKGNARKGLGLYAESLLHPETVLAKIPDFESWESTTFQMAQDGVITTTTDGSAAAIFYPSGVTGGQLGAGGGAPTTMGTAIKASGAQGNWLTQSQQVNPSSNSIVSNFALIRPVSAVLLLEFIGSTSNDQGQVCVGPLFRGETAPPSFDQALGNEYNFTCPIRNGVRFLWKPVDMADLNYEPCVTNYVSGVYSTGVARPVVGGPTGGATPTVGNFLPHTAITAFVSGAVASTAVLRFRWVVNFEGVPEIDSMALFETTPSECNPGLLAQGMNMMASIPWGTVWQKSAGIAGAMAEQALSSQLPTLAASAGAMLMSRSRGTGRLTYDIPLD